MGESNTDPKSNPLIPAEESEPQKINSPSTREGPGPDPEKIQQMLEEATGKDADLGDDLRLVTMIGHAGYAVNFDLRSVGNIQRLPPWALERIQEYFRRHPMGNELIPGPDED